MSYIKNFLKKIILNINLFRIEKNHKKVLKTLKKKILTEKINIIFYVYDETKWKCQKLYELLEKHENFNVEIIATKSATHDKTNPTWQDKNKVLQTYNFFKKQNMKVEYGYDIQKNKFISFKKFKPDIIIYQHPWSINYIQSPIYCSSFSLSAYIPYYFPNIFTKIDYDLDLILEVNKYYVFDKNFKNTYKDLMKNKGKNIKIVGQPYLDYYHENNKQENYYTIYAPHWSICNTGVGYGTFHKNYKMILDYAISHPEKNWLFKPHPLLKKSILDLKVMTKKELENYYSKWNEIGEIYESGNYLDYFQKSQLLITDCGSFLGEYFITGKPVIHLVSDKKLIYTKTTEEIIKTYYKAHNLEELKALLDKLPQDDYIKSKRLEILKKLNYENNNASQNIINDILYDLHSL